MARLIWMKSYQQRNRLNNSRNINLTTCTQRTRPCRSCVSRGVACVLWALRLRPVPGRDSGSSMASVLIEPTDTLSPSDNRESRLPNQHNKTRNNWILIKALLANFLLHVCHFVNFVADSYFPFCQLCQDFLEKLTMGLPFLQRTLELTVICHFFNFASNFWKSWQWYSWGRVWIQYLSSAKCHLQLPRQRWLTQFFTACWLAFWKCSGKSCQLISIYELTIVLYSLSHHWRLHNNQYMPRSGIPLPHHLISHIKWFPFFSCQLISIYGKMANNSKLQHTLELTIICHFVNFASIFWKSWQWYSRGRVWVQHLSFAKGHLQLPSNLQLNQHCLPGSIVFGLTGAFFPFRGLYLSAIYMYFSKHDWNSSNFFQHG